MSAVMTPRAALSPAWWAARVHERLMPDYNRKAAVYWWSAVTAGAAVLLHAIQTVAGLPAPALWQAAGATALAMLAGFVPVRVPRSTNSFTAGEIFIFLLLLVHGPGAAALAAACEALVGSWRSSKRWTSRIISPCTAAIAMFAAGSALYAVLGALKDHGLHNEGFLLFGAICFALGYFLFSTVLVTVVPYLKRNERFPLRGFVDSYGWLGVAYIGHASVATLLYLSFRQSGLVVVVAAIPIIVILLTTGHFFFRREEAEETVRKAREQQAQQHQMLEMARHAGMAEIATNVLHNVGNVLNSVNVSAELIGDRVRASESPGLARVVQLMDQHAADLGDYLAQDKRGKLLPTYLKQLSEVLEQERQAVLAELAALTKSVKHVKEIVATQQSYAGVASVVAPMRVSELIEDALRIDASSGGGQAIAVAREFEDLPRLMLDKHRILLTLVNLISNARHAMARQPPAERRLALRVARTAAGLLRVEVEDNGEGIPPENLTRIFAHGFTTRQDGHGFGLHSCALAAREMGGALTVRSDGPGKGACFTLEIPAEEASGN
jgi:signal transduction histidine kinase